MNPNSYWLILNGEKAGPFGRDELARRVRDGVMGAGDPVWRAGLDRWVPAGELEDTRGLWEVAEPEAVAEDDGPVEEPVVVPVQAGVLRRFFARWLDLLFYVSLWWGSLALSGCDLEAWMNGTWSPVLQFGLWVVVESLWIHGLGATPGKALLGISVRMADGRRLALLPSLRRAVLALVASMLLAMLLLVFQLWIVPLLVAWRVWRPVPLFWDRVGGHVLPVRRLRWWSVPVYLALFLVLSQLLGSLMVPVMSRDPRMVEQFPWLKEAGRVMQENQGSRTGPAK